MTLNEAIIHARELADRIEKDGCIDCANEHRQLADWLEELKRYKSADVVGVKHGYWIWISANMIECSCCGDALLDKAYNWWPAETPYCPNCGAKMDGGI